MDESRPSSKRPKQSQELLFLYLGTVIVEFTVEVDIELMTTIFTWNTPVNSTQRLRDAVPNQYSKIKKDLRDIKRVFNPREDISLGTFRRGNEYTPFVYRHAAYFTYSRVKLKDMAQFTTVDEERKLLPPCLENPCHEVYLPYFHSNSQCELILRSVNIDQTSAPFAQLQEMPNQDAGTFEEDDWTHQLHVCFCS